jgi:hypothetical protein
MIYDRSEVILRCPRFRVPDQRFDRAKVGVEDSDV